MLSTHPLAAARQRVAEIDSAELRRRVAAGARLIDVREPHETRGGGIDGAILMPLGDLLADPSAVAATAPVVVVCAKGLRARRAAEALRERGVDARVLAGGLAAWT